MTSSGPSVQPHSRSSSYQVSSRPGYGLASERDAGLSGSLTANRGLAPGHVNDHGVVAAASLEGGIALAECWLLGQVLLGDRLAEQIHQLAADGEPLVGKPELGGVAVPVPFLPSDKLAAGAWTVPGVRLPAWPVVR
jgi:hypothetical protein